MSEKSKVIKTKKVILDGKSYTIELTEDQMNDFRKQADVCKLNGHDFKYYMDVMIPSWAKDDWPGMAAIAFTESNPKLEVGMGATMNLWSDRRAMTIVEIVSPKKIVVAHNKTRCRDYFAGNYDILGEIDEGMGKSVFTLRRNGTWVEEGQKKEFGSVTLTVGFRRHYIDPSF